MESRISEEVACLNEAIRSENGKAFDISVIIIQIFTFLTTLPYTRLLGYRPILRTSGTLQNVLHKAISNNICYVILGKRFDYDDKHFEEVMHQLLSP